MLHLAFLRSSWRGRAGQELLARRYAIIARGHGATGFVAIRNGRIAGYVCGVWDARSLRRTLLRCHFPALLFWALVGLSRDPTALLRMLLARRNHEARPPSPRAGYELRPIVVVPKERGRGVAAALVARLVEDAAARGYREIFLVTEHDNLAARRFYQRCGFAHIGQETRGGDVYLRFSLETAS